MVWGSIISAAGNIIGGLVGRNDNQGFQSEMADRNAILQKEFAQNGVRWRVEDAKAAGIHPLFALGMNPVSASPISVFPDDSLSSGLMNASQDIGRAIDSTRTESERTNARLTALAVDRAELQNELLRSQIARLQQSATPPTPGDAYMIPGQTSSGTIENKPLERVQGHADAPWQEPGAITDLGFARTDTGLAPVPSKDVKERIEDQMVPELMWALRNQLLPNLGHGSKPPKSALPDGAYDWAWSYAKQEWQPRFYPKLEERTDEQMREWLNKHGYGRR